MVMQEFLVFGAHVAGGKDADERSRSSDAFDFRTPVGFLAFDETHGTDNLEAKFARGLNRLDGRSTRGAHVVHNHDLCSLSAKALYALSRTMLLFHFSNQKAVQLQSSMGSCHRRGSDDRIRAHGEAADGLGFPAPSLNLFEEHFSGKAGALGIQRRGAAIDVVIASAAGGKLEVPQPEGFLGQEA